MTAETAIFLDLKGLNCPLPVLRLAKAMRGAPAGACFHVVATDPMAKLDIAHYCRTKGHRLLRSAEDNGALVFLVEAGTGDRKSADPE